MITVFYYTNIQQFMSILILVLIMVNTMQGSDQFDVTIDLHSSDYDSVEISASVIGPEYKVEIYNSMTREPIEDIEVDFTVGHKYNSQHHNKQTRKSTDLRVYVETPKNYQDCSAKCKNDTITIFCTPKLPTTEEKKMDMLYSVLKKSSVFATFQSHIIKMIAKYFLLESIPFTFWSPKELQNQIHTVQFSSNLRQMVTASLIDNKIMVWDVAHPNNEPIQIFDNQKLVQDAYFFGQDQYIISLTKYDVYRSMDDPELIKVWDIETGEREQVPQFQRSYTVKAYIKVSENTKLVAFTRDSMVLVFEKSNGQYILEEYLVLEPVTGGFEGSLTYPSCFNKNESVIAASQSKIWAWDIRTGTLKYNIEPRVHIEHFFVTSKYVYIKTKDITRIFNVKDGEYTKNFRHKDGANQEYIYVSANDHFIVTFDFSNHRNTAIYVVDLESGDKKVTIPLRRNTGPQFDTSRNFYNAFSILDNKENQLVFIGGKEEGTNDSTNAINTHVFTTTNKPDKEKN